MATYYLFCKNYTLNCDSVCQYTIMPDVYPFYAFCNTVIDILFTFTYKYFVTYNYIKL